MARRKNILKETYFHDYYSRLKNIALSVFQWEGLPETCSARFLENCLFSYGCAVFVKDPEFGYLNLKATPAAELNVYEEPTAYTAHSTGYNGKIFKADECVFIRNNYLAKSTDHTIMLFAERLAAIEAAIQVNINAQKTPILIRCEEKSRNSLQAVYNQYEGDKPVIIGTKALQEKPFEVLATGAPFVADKLREEKRAVWNEALEFLGVNTNPADKKKERLIVDEVESNNEQIEIQNDSMMLTRQEAAAAINAMFSGLNVSVSRRLDDHDQESAMEGGAD